MTTANVAVAGVTSAGGAAVLLTSWRRAGTTTQAGVTSMAKLETKIKTKEGTP
ncbi:MAG: hypothetical protein WD534_03855 [Phycisphaeraceae bacterium]